MNSLTASLYFFGFIMVELSLLFVGISTLIGLILEYIPEEKLRRWLSRTGIKGNVIGASIGGLTPFCACSTIPMTVGLLKAKIPFGAVMSFVVASPILNPVILAMMTALLGLKAAGIYAVMTFGAAILFGVILERFGFSRYVKNVRVTGGRYGGNNHPTFGAKLKAAFRSAMGDFRSVLIYLVIGVALGAGIYGYMPQDFVIRLAGPQNPFAIPIAALIGVPLYIRAETAIPIGLALMQKGMSTGAVIALIIGGAGMAIPEITMLAGIFRTQLVGALVCVIFLTAVTAGLVFNLG